MTDFDNNIDQYFSAQKAICDVLGEIGATIKIYSDYHWMIVEIPRFTKNERMCVFSSDPFSKDSFKNYYANILDGHVFLVDRSSGEHYTVIGTTVEGLTDYADQLLVVKKELECKDEEVKKSYIEWTEMNK